MQFQFRPADMNEVDATNSLVMLANVALTHRPKIRPPRRIVYSSIPKPLKRKKCSLTLRTLNSEHYVDIMDLKCTPIRYLSKIFVHSDVVEESHCSVYVCKFEGCNTKFFNNQENGIRRMEHIVQCHLLNHIFKLKPGSLVKIPKCILASEENIPSTRESKLIVKPRSKTKYEEIEWKSVEQKMVDSSAADKVEMATSKTIPLQELAIMKKDNIPKHIRTKGAAFEKLESRCTTIDRTSQYQIRVDHPYYNPNETPPDSSPVVPNKCAMIPVEYQPVNVNQLYYLNGESSSELNSFMIHETLNDQVSIVSMNDGETTFDRLPLVGREAEVTTEEVETTVVDEKRPRLDESYFPCSKCDIVLSSKQMLYSHMRNKHFDTTMVLKPYKGPTRTRTRPVTAELKTVKRKFEMLSAYRNADLYEVVKENGRHSDTNRVKQEESILKAALMKEPNKKPVINISNILNNINVQIH